MRGKVTIEQLQSWFSDPETELEKEDRIEQEAKSELLEEGVENPTEEQIKDKDYEVYYLSTENAIASSITNTTIKDGKKQLIDPRILPKLHIV